MKFDKLPGPPPDSALATRILKKHPYGHFTAIIYGTKRCGKSIYALRTMWEIFEALGYDTDTAYDMALEHFMFKPREFIDFIYDAMEKTKGSEKNKMPIACLDDASMGLSGQSYRTPDTLDAYYELRDVWAMMGTAVTCVLMTTPEPDDISVKFGWDMRIHITQRDDEWRRIATGYTEKLIGKRKTKKVSRQGGYIEEFSSYLPNRLYAKLRDRRMKYLYDVRAKHQALRDKKAKKQVELREKEIEEAFGSPESPKSVHEEGVDSAVKSTDNEAVVVRPRDTLPLNDSVVSESS